MRQGFIFLFALLFLLLCLEGPAGVGVAWANGPGSTGTAAGEATQDPQEGARKDPELARFLGQMDAAYQKIRSFQADFDQVSETKTIQREKHSSGRVYFLKPDRMRWRYHAPEVRDIYLLGELIYVHMPSQNMVIEQMLGQALPGTAPARLFMGVRVLTESFFISRAPDRNQGDKAACLRLTPREKKGIAVEEILLWIGKEDFLPVRTESRDILGNRTTLNFQNQKANPSLGEGLFRFQIPADAEIVRNPY